MFGYLFFVILLVMAVLAVRVRRNNKKLFSPAFWILLITAAGYFIAVSKTALLLGNTSNRYQLPIYGIVVLLILNACKILWRQTVALSGVGRAAAFLIKHRKVVEKAAIAFCPAMVVSGYVCVDVAFLYPEAREAVALAREQAAEKIPAVYVYKPGEEWCIWAVADELMEYDRVYFIAADSEELIKEPAVMDADAVVIYLPCRDDGKEEAAQSMWLLSGNAKLSEGRLQYRHKYCSEWYYCGDKPAADSGDKP